ncbi:hypothetical protein BASA83_000191 [Batrachochytrium salamandrivorans]|nr:hypothetical protein BASA83_000191 [Batrachochytrium salamandrivorans]
MFQLVYVVETQQYSKKPQCTTSTTTTTTTAAAAAAIVTTPCNTTDSRDARSPLLQNWFMPTSLATTISKAAPLLRPPPPTSVP